MLDDRREVTDQHRGWRMDSKKAGGAGFPWMFDHCVHFFATAKYLMNESKIKEVYSLKSDISWMHDATKHALDRANMNIYRPERVGRYSDHDVVLRRSRLPRTMDEGGVAERKI